MRAREVILLALLLAAPAFARADDACVWKDSGKPSRVLVNDRVAIFREYYSPTWAACLGSAAPRDVEVQWLLAADPDAPPIHSEKIHIHAPQDDGPIKLESRLFPGQVCDKPRPDKPQRKLAVAGPPGGEEVVELVPVRAHVKAAGALSPLEYMSPPVDIPCPTCGSNRSGDISVVVADNERDLVIEAKLDPAWFECARRDATLSLLAFAGDSERAVSTAIQPDLVVADLEKELVRKGDGYVLRKPLPMGRICSKKARFWAFEVWGRGELMHAGGGGREVREVRCP
jgi:hypothetical protein